LNVFVGLKLGLSSRCKTGLNANVYDVLFVKFRDVGLKELMLYNFSRNYLSVLAKVGRLNGLSFGEALGGEVIIFN